MNELLRGRIVSETSDTKIQRRLLAEPKLTVRLAPDVAIALEISEKDALNLQKSTLQGEDVVHKLHDTVRDPKSPNTFTSVIR